MLSSRNRFYRWPFTLLLLAAFAPCMTGCGGGSGGPQGNPTPKPTTPPVASERIAWMSDRDGTFRLYVMNGDGTGQVRITQNTGLERSPSWSPDGSKLVFSYSPDRTLASAEIYSIQSNGTGLRRISNDSLEDNSPAFSRDGQYVVWSRIRSSSSSAIFIAKSDGSETRQLSTTNETARTPSFDSQGRIVYSAKDVNASGIDARYQIVRVNRDGSGHTQLTNTDSNLYAPSVSPDGNTLLYVDDDSGDFELYTSPIASFVPQRLPFTLAGDTDPSWTPDGRILFSSLRNDNPEIYVVNRDGSALRRLTNNPTTDRLPVAIGASAR